jgi:hypothetical protein
LFTGRGTGNGIIRNTEHERELMKTKLNLLVTVAALLTVPLPAGLRAEGVYSQTEVPEACARAATPRGLQTFHWLVCAPQRRSQWASSERVRNPELVAPPRFVEQLPPEKLVEPKRPASERYLVRTTYGEFQRTHPQQANTRPVQLSQLKRPTTARGGASQLMDFTN